MSKRKKYQQVLVPKGTIDPNEDTVIQIPQNLAGQTLVVGGKKASERQMVMSRSSNKSIQFDDEDRRTFVSSPARPRTPAPFDRDDGPRTVIRADASMRDSFGYEEHPFGLDSRTRTLDQTLHTSISLDELDRTEQAEKQLVQRKLEDFQKARRTFLLETTSIATQSTQMPQPSSDPFAMSPTNRSFGSFRSAPLNHSFTDPHLDDPLPMMESTFISRSPRVTSMMHRSATTQDLRDEQREVLDLDDDKMDEEFADGKLSSCSKTPKTKSCCSTTNKDKAVRSGILKSNDLTHNDKNVSACKKQKNDTQQSDGLSQSKRQDVSELNRGFRGAGYQSTQIRPGHRKTSEEYEPSTQIVAGVETQTSNNQLLVLEDEDYLPTSQKHSSKSDAGYSRGIIGQPSTSSGSNNKPCGPEIHELCPIRNIESSCSRPGGNYLSASPSSLNDKTDDFVRQCRSEMRKQYNHNELDIHQLEKLKNQFNEARRKLDEVISLVNMSLSIASTSAVCSPSNTPPALQSCMKKNRQSVDLELPVKDLPDDDDDDGDDDNVICPKKIENMIKSWKKMDLTCHKENVKTIICKDSLPDRDPAPAVAPKTSCRMCKGSKNSLNKPLEKF